jgi:DNA-binding NarL/FixJ family response regulator
MITIAVVDDEKIFREGLGAWIRAEGLEIDLVAGAVSVDGLLAAVPEPPDVVVLDVILRNGSRLGANIARLREWGAEVVIVSSDDSSAEMRRTAMREHAQAFLHKNDGFAEVFRAVGEAAAGRPYINAQLARFLYREGDKVALTDRQAEVLRLYSSGMSTAEVARRLFVTQDTVKSHLLKIRDKYRDAGRPASSRAELADVARQDGYLDEW